MLANVGGKAVPEAAPADPSAPPPPPQPASDRPSASAPASRTALARMWAAGAGTISPVIGLAPISPYCLSIYILRQYRRMQQRAPAHAPGSRPGPVPGSGLAHAWRWRASIVLVISRARRMGARIFARGGCMSLRLVQVELDGGARGVAAIEPGRQPDAGGRIAAVRLAGVTSLYQLAGAALAEGRSLQEAALARRTSEVLDIGGNGSRPRLLPPIDHPDPAHLYLTGTGLTHLGSAESRDRMHALAATGGAQTDSMRMFLDGLK